MITPSTTAPHTHKRRMSSKKKICRFCADHKIWVDYKEAKLLVPFVTERGKLIPRRITGNCAFHQRRVQEAVQRARILALLPFTTIHQS